LRGTLRGGGGRGSGKGRGCGRARKVVCPGPALALGGPASNCRRVVVAFLTEPERKSPLGKIPTSSYDVIMTSSYE